jgi:hypothetical protein
MNKITFVRTPPGSSSAILHIYDIRPRKDHRGFDLISDALLFGRLWYGEPGAISNAIDYAVFFSLFTPCHSRL